MPVTFVIGRAGSGKTHRCFTRIVEALRADPLGPPIIWLLPRQATFMEERRLTCEPTLGGFCRARVLSFEQLGHELAAEGGDSTLPEVTRIGRKMILGHLLRSHAPKLKFFNSNTRQAGMVTELEATFDEFERSGKSPADLAAAAKDLNDDRHANIDGIALADKIHDLHLLYDAYELFLGQEQLDPHRRMLQVLRQIESSQLFKDAVVYIDGFTEFSDLERRMLAAIAKSAADVEITCLIDPASPVIFNPRSLPVEMSLFHRTERTFSQLWTLFSEHGVSVGAPVLLKKAIRWKSPRLASIDKVFGALSSSPAGSKPPGDDSIEQIVAPDRTSEVDAVARRIRLLLETGMRLRDIAVIVRDFTQYQTAIATSFDEHNIPYFADRRRPAANHPLTQLLRCSLQIARTYWGEEAIFGLIKTGLASLTLEEADSLENYIVLHGLHGSCWEADEPWTWREDLLPPADDPAELEAQHALIDGLRRRVAEPLLPLVRAMRGSKPMPVKQFSAEIFAMFERFGVRKKLAEWAVGPAPDARDAALELERVSEDKQVWQRLCDLFQQMVDLLGDTELELDDLTDIIDAALETFDLALTPPTIDQVLVGQADRTRCPPVKGVFVLGLNEGEFPAVPKPTTVLSDRDRRWLSERRIELDPDTRRRLLDERLIAYTTLTQPSEKLILSRSLSNDQGRKTEPSVFWRRIDEAIGPIKSTMISHAKGGSAADIATPRQLISGLMHWARRVAMDEIAIDSEPGWRFLYRWLAISATQFPAIARLRDLAWRGLGYTNSATLTADAPRLFQSPIVARAGEFEVMAACPYRHFAKYGLRLQAPKRPAITSGDLSQLCHRILSRLQADAMKSPMLDDLPLGISPKTLASARATHKGRALNTARDRYLASRIERMLMILADAHQARMRRGKFRPALGAAHFGASGKLPALRIPSARGNEAFLEGKFDRVDSHAETGQAILIDYQTRAFKPSFQRIAHGLSLELLLNMLVLDEHKSHLNRQRLSTVGALIVPLVQKIEDVDHPDKAAEVGADKHALGDKPRGFFIESVAADLDSQCEAGHSDAYAFYRLKGGGFGHPRTSDAKTEAELQELVSQARTHVADLTDRIIDGDISIAPYRLGNQSPCAGCEYHGLCRFETSTNQYRFLDSLNRDNSDSAAEGGRDE